MFKWLVSLCPNVMLKLLLLLTIPVSNSNFNMSFLCLYSSSCKSLCVFVKGVINKRRLDWLVEMAQEWLSEWPDSLSKWPVTVHPNDPSMSVQMTSFCLSRWFSLCPSKWPFWVCTNDQSLSVKMTREHANTRGIRRVANMLLNHRMSQRGTSDGYLTEEAYLRLPIQRRVSRDLVVRSKKGSMERTQSLDIWVELCKLSCAFTVPLRQI